MEKYVVAYLCLHADEIEMQEVSAKSEYDALINVLELDSDIFVDINMIHQYCADTDSYIGIYKL